MLYQVFNPEDGRIHQSNKIFDPTPAYEDVLAQLQHKWIKMDTARFIAGDEYMVVKEQMTERPSMNIVISKTTIQSGEKDCIKFTNVPKPVMWRLECMGALVHMENLNKDVLEISVPVPGLYKVIFEQWPYIDTIVDFEAVA